ncbi:MAG: hypothetical protein AAF471_01360 [Myxococcota bacterium]
MKPRYKKPSDTLSKTHESTVQGLANAFRAGDYGSVRGQAQRIERSPQSDPGMRKQAQTWRHRTGIDPVVPALGLAVLVANIVVALMVGQ